MFNGWALYAMVVIGFANRCKVYLIIIEYVTIKEIIYIMVMRQKKMHNYNCLRLYNYA